MSFSTFVSNLFSNKKAYPMATWEQDMQPFYDKSNGSWDTLHIEGLKILAQGKAVPERWLDNRAKTVFQSYYDCRHAWYDCDEQGASYIRARSPRKVAQYLEKKYGILAPEEVTLKSGSDIPSVVLGYDPQKMEKQRLAASVKAQKLKRKQAKPSV